MLYTNGHCGSLKSHTHSTSFKRKAGHFLTYAKSHWDPGLLDSETQFFCLDMKEVIISKYHGQMVFALSTIMSIKI